MESAALTYTQSLTFPYKAKTTKNYSGTSLSANGTEFMFSDFVKKGTDYEITCDVYAILFTVKAASPVDTMVLGAGTTVLENCSKATSDYWVQADLVPSEEQGKPFTLISADESKSEYTFMWTMPGVIASGVKPGEDLSGAS